MSAQKLKKGFTLIELMVVIVIIGILAAVAIPKLFGMSAKAKASEVGPAAGTYVKMQQAYVMETGDRATDIKQTGYELPGSGGTTSNFDYNGTNATTFSAVSKFEATDCKASNTWTVIFASATGTAMKSQVPTEGGCLALTPNFTKIAGN